MACITMVISTRYFYQFVYVDRWGGKGGGVHYSFCFERIREIMKTMCGILIMYLIKYFWIWYLNFSKQIIHEKRRAAKTWKKMVEQKNQSIPLSCPCSIVNQKSVTRNQGKMVENKKNQSIPLNYPCRAIINK